MNSKSIMNSTGWRRLIGSPKLQIIFHKRATKYRSLLRKMTYKDKGSYESSPPCSDIMNSDFHELYEISQTQYRTRMCIRELKWNLKYTNSMKFKFPRTGTFVEGVVLLLL